MRLECVEIRQFCSKDMNGFKAMFNSYFREDLKIEFADTKMEDICSEIANSVTLEITWLDMLLIDNNLAGFIYYQIDNPESDWCEREGWGFIREVYIKGDMRRKGLATKFVTHVENELYNKGARHIYLTSDEMGQFWSYCGYKNTNKCSDMNHCPIYEK